MDPIPLCVPFLGEAERQRVDACLRSGWVSSVGPFVDEFERSFARCVGSPHAVACASGTAAIHLALRAAGVQPGDRVLCSDCTFIASANPAAYQGAAVGFIDAEPRSWNLDPALVERALQEWAPVKAVIAVHILGQPADLAPIAAACARHGTILIEDAAESLGATYADGRQTGTIGAIGCFSFNGNKVITTGGGGMCVTADPALAARLKHLSTQAKMPGTAFHHDDIGYNYRLPNLNAALGLAQLEQLPAFLARKRAISDRYRTWFAAHDLEWQGEPVGTRSSCWLASGLVPDRDRVLERLAAAGIGARPVWGPLADEIPWRGARRWGGAVGTRIAREGISLPCSVGLTEAQQTQVIAALEAACR